MLPSNSVQIKPYCIGINQLMKRLNTYTSNIDKKHLITKYAARQTSERTPGPLSLVRVYETSETVQKQSLAKQQKSWS